MGYLYQLCDCFLVVNVICFHYLMPFVLSSPQAIKPPFGNIKYDFLFSKVVLFLIGQIVMHHVAANSSKKSVQSGTQSARAVLLNVVVVAIGPFYFH